MAFDESQECITKAGIHFDGIQICSLSRPLGDKKAYAIVKDVNTFQSACVLVESEKERNSLFAVENTKATAHLKKSLAALELAETSYQGASHSFGNMLVHFGDAHFPGFVDAQMVAVFKATYFSVLSGDGHEAPAVSAQTLKSHVKNFVEYRVKAHNLEMYYRREAFYHSKDVSKLKGAHRGGGGEALPLSVPGLLAIEIEDDSLACSSFFKKASPVPELSKEGLVELKSIKSESGSRYPIQIVTPIGPNELWSELQQHTRAVQAWWSETFHVGISDFLRGIPDVPENRRNGLFLNQCCLEEQTVLYLQGRLVERLRLSAEEAEYAVHKDNIWSIVPEKGTDLWMFANDRPHVKHGVLLSSGNLLLRAKTSRKCWPQAEFFLGYGRSIRKVSVGNVFKYFHCLTHIYFKTQRPLKNPDIYQRERGKENLTQWQTTTSTRP